LVLPDVGAGHRRTANVSAKPVFKKNILAVRCNPETGQRTLDALRWGLIPSWAKDEKIGYRNINARAETVDSICDYNSEGNRLEMLGLNVEVREHQWVKWRSLYFYDPEGNRVELVSYDENLTRSPHES
jgi:hypothetical protein